MIGKKTIYHSINITIISRFWNISLLYKVTRYKYTPWRGKTNFNMCTSSIFLKTSGLAIAAGASSMIFWCLRCTEQSLPKMDIALPYSSAKSCTSKCLALEKKKVNYTDYHLSFSYFLHWSCSISMTEDFQYRVYEKLLSQTGKDHEESWLYHLQEYEGYTIKQVKDQRIIVRRPWFLFSWILKWCHSAFINRWNTATLKTCTWGPCTLRENILHWHFANLILEKKTDCFAV